MKLITGAFLLSLLVPLSSPGALVGRYKMDAASGNQPETAGVDPAAPAIPQGTALLYQQADAPSGTYGNIQLPPGTLTRSGGFPASVSTSSADCWVATTSSPTITAPTRYNNLLNNFTVMGWIKPATVTGTHRLFSSQVSGVTNHSWGVGVTGSKVRFTDYGQYDIDSGASPVTAGVWQHIAAVKSSTGGILLYHNGVLVHTDATRTAAITATPNATTNWRLLNGPLNEIFAGLAADIRVYDTALTQPEILLAAGHQAAPTGVLQNDFVPPNNPYLNFSHGTKASVTAEPLTLFTTSAGSSVNKPASRLNDATDDLWVGKASSTLGGVIFPAAGGKATDWVANNVYHAWSGGRTGYLTTRLTVQTTGYYDLSATWRSHTQTGTKAQVAAVRNGTPLFNAAVEGFAGSAASTVAVSGTAPVAAYVQPGYSLTAGDTLDFVTIPDAAAPAGNLSLAVSALPASGPPLATGTLVISEFMASNSNSIGDEDGRKGDWIEFYNGTGATIDLTNWSLTDTAAQPRKWTFPAGRTIAHGQFLVIFADDRDGEKRPSYNAASTLHANFQLSGAGEYLGLIDPSGTVVDAYAPKFPAQTTDIAYGRSGTAGPAVGFLLPTPGKVNGTATSSPPGVVSFDAPGGVFTSPTTLSVALKVVPAGQIIRYTTNNTEPTLANGTTYTVPLTISTTTIVRARAFIDGVGGLPGESLYLFVAATAQPSAANTYKLPVVVIDTMAGGTLTNAEKSAMLAVYEPGPDGQTVLTGKPKVLSRGSSHVRGQSSAGYAKQGFDLEFWDERGEDRKVPLLGMPEDGDWALYAPYEFDRAYMNNRLAYELAGRMGRYAPRTRFVELYLNTDGGALSSTDYYGVYVLVENVQRAKNRVDVDEMTAADSTAPNLTGGYIVAINKSDEAETVLASGLPYMRNMRQNKSTIILTGGMTTFLDYPKMGSVTPTQVSYIDNYLKLTEDAIYGANYKNPTTGLHYTDYIGRDTFIDFHIAQTVPQNIDALRLSTYFYKERNGKLKAGPVWDFDRSFNSRDSRNNTPAVWDTQGNLDKTEYFYYGWWWKLFKDPDFMQAWIDRYTALRRSGQPLDYTGVIVPIMDAFAAEVAPAGTTVNAASRDYARWPQSTGLGSARLPYATEVANQKTWLNTRFNFMDGQMLKVPVPSVPAGVVALNSTVSFSLTGASASAQIYVTKDGTDPRLPGGGINPAATVLTNNGSITLNASALVRYRQRDTTVPAFNADLTTTKMSPWSGLGESYYIAGATRAAAGQLTVATLHYHPGDPSAAEIAAGFTDADQFEYIELMNISSGRINLQGCRFSEGFDFTFPASLSSEIAPGETVLVVKNLAAFTLRHGTTAAARVAGEFNGNDNLNNAGEAVTLLASDGVTPLVSFLYDDETPWPAEADGTGPALVLIAPRTNPDLSDPYSWRLSAAPGGAPVTGDRQTYAAWKASAGVNGETEDTDGDGLVPLLEYALGGETTKSSANLLPSVSVDATGAMRVQFTRSLTAGDVAYAVQVSDTLAGWTAIPATVLTRSFGPGTETLTLSVPPPAPGTGHRFVRVLFSLR